MNDVSRDDPEGRGRRCVVDVGDGVFKVRALSHPCRLYVGKRPDRKRVLAASGPERSNSRCAGPRMQEEGAAKTAAANVFKRVSVSSETGYSWRGKKSKFF
jgi:hypothetical protein